MPDTTIQVENSESQDNLIIEVRESVAKLCGDFQGEYWRKLDREQAYPTEFVKALTDAGFLGALIPEEYGGVGLGMVAASVILEEIHNQGCNAAACHAQMYTMGTVLRHGSEEQKKEYLPKIADGTLRLQAFGVTEPTSGTDTTSLRTVAVRDGDEYVINGQKIWTSRAEHSDLMLLLARTTPLNQVSKKTEGLSVFLLDMRKAKGNGLTIRPIKTMMNHATTEVFFDNLRIPIKKPKIVARNIPIMATINVLNIPTINTSPCVLLFKSKPVAFMPFVVGINPAISSMNSKPGAILSRSKLVEVLWYKKYPNPIKKTIASV